MKKLIGFELRAPPRVPNPMSFSIATLLLLRYKGVKMSTFHRSVALIGSTTQLSHTCVRDELGHRHNPRLSDAL